MEEFEELYATFQTDARANLFTFVELFSFESDTFLFLGTTYCPEDPESLRSLFRKARKVAFRETTTQELARRLIWFCAQKVLYAQGPDGLLLDRSERRELILLTDMYLERT